MLLIVTYYYCLCYRWYPGCNFVQNYKDRDFIKNARAGMSINDEILSSALDYRRGDLSFLRKLFDL